MVCGVHRMNNVFIIKQMQSPSAHIQSTYLPLCILSGAENKAGEYYATLGHTALSV